MDIVMKTRQELERLADPAYKTFSAGLNPGVTDMLGVRLPQLRQLAKNLAGDDWKQYLEASPDSFEERMLQGILIGAIRVSPEERLHYIAAFVPKIDCWSVCDSFCSGLKFTAKNQELVWAFLQPYLQTKEEYQLRFAIIMLMDYYLTNSYIDAVLQILDGVHHDGYYVKMAVAWTLATALAKQPDPTWQYLQQHHLDEDTWKKTIQKCLESRRIPEDQKAELRRMRSQLAKE